jgi:hypothetical protein
MPMGPLQLSCDACGDYCRLPDDREKFSAQIAAFTAAHLHDGLRIRIDIPIQRQGPVARGVLVP